MQNIQGFLLLNIYALIICVIISIIFFKKDRQNKIEDQTYSKLLITTILVSISGLILGLIVNPIFNVNEFIIKIFNKIYLVCLLLWILIMTFYTLCVSIIKNDKLLKLKKFFSVLILENILIIIILPITVEITDKSIISLGLSIFYTYAMFALGFVFQIICVIIDFKNANSKKYIPLYLLAFFGMIVLILQMVFPSMNYLINPTLIIITIVMYHTIENPDKKLLNEIMLAKEELEQANQVKSEFISSMSHEIRTPINALVGFSDIARDAKTLKEAKENSEYIINASNDLLNILDKLTQVFAIEREDNDINEIVYEPKEKLMQVIELYEDKIKNKGLDLKVNIKDMPTLVGDVEIIKKITLYILENAYKFTKTGAITFKASYTKEKLNIIIEDTGIGIKEHELKKIFSSFNKSSDTKNSSYSGMGLGLSITKRLVDKLNGTIDIKSKYGEYTIVTIKIKQNKAKN